MLWSKTKLPMFLSFLDITVAMVTAAEYLTKKWSVILPKIESFATVIVAFRKKNHMLFICSLMTENCSSSAESSNIILYMNNL